MKTILEIILSIPGSLLVILFSIAFIQHLHAQHHPPQRRQPQPKPKEKLPDNVVPIQAKLMRDIVDATIEHKK